MGGETAGRRGLGREIGQGGTARSCRGCKRRLAQAARRKGEGPEGTKAPALVKGAAGAEKAVTGRRTPGVDAAATAAAAACWRARTRRHPRLLRGRGATRAGWCALGAQRGAVARGWAAPRRRRPRGGGRRAAGREGDPAAEVHLSGRRRGETALSGGDGRSRGGPVQRHLPTEAQPIRDGQGDPGPVSAPRDRGPGDGEDGGFHSSSQNGLSQNGLSQNGIFI